MLLVDLSRGLPHDGKQRNIQKQPAADGAKKNNCSRFPDSMEYRTGVIRAWCEFASWLAFSYQRGLRANEVGVASVIRLTAGGLPLGSSGLR